MFKQVTIEVDDDSTLDKIENALRPHGIKVDHVHSNTYVALVDECDSAEDAENQVEYALENSMIRCIVSTLY